MTDSQALERMVRSELCPSTSAGGVDRAVEALGRLGRQAYRDGDHEAYTSFQSLLYELHYGGPADEHWKRQYLASSVYEIEAGRIASPTLPSERDVLLPADELRRRLWDQQRELSPLEHPMFRMLFSEDVTIEQVLIYLRQQWLILQYFWLQFVELATRLERLGTPIELLTVIYDNVWEELGRGDPSASHVEQHRSRQTALGLVAGFRQRPDFPETMDYINTRLRLMRSSHPAAALGSVFSQEATAQSYGLQHHIMLQRVGIEARYGQVYADHATLDVAHAEEVIQVAEALITTREQQEAFLAGHRAQMLIWQAHMDRVVPLLRGEPDPANGRASGREGATTGIQPGRHRRPPSLTSDRRGG